MEIHLETFAKAAALTGALAGNDAVKTSEVVVTSCGSTSVTTFCDQLSSYTNLMSLTFKSLQPYDLKLNGICISMSSRYM